MSERLTTLLFLAPLLFASVAASAPSSARAGDDPFTRRGGYVGIAGAFGGEIFEDVLADLTSASVGVDNTGGLIVRGGYRIFPWLAAEGMYEWMEGFGLKFDGIEVGKLTTHTFMFNPKLFLPIRRFQPYILLGIGGHYAEFDRRFPVERGTGAWAFAGRPGLGADVYVTEALALNLEFAGVLPLTDFEDGLRTVTQLFYFSASAGLQYRF